MAGKYTSAYAGHGKITPENAAALLDQNLPQALGRIFIPENITRRQQGLLGVTQWFEKEISPDATIPVEDLVAALVERRDREGDNEDPGNDEVVLVMVYDPDNESDIALAQAAHDAGIKVVDITKAWAEMEFAEPEPEAPEEPAEEEPPFVPDEPTERAEVPKPEPVREAIDRAKEAGEEAARIAQEAVSNLAKAQPSGLNLVIPLHFSEDALETVASILAKKIVEAMARQAQLSVAQADTQPVATVTPINAKSAAGPDDPQPPGTVVYYVNSDTGLYRPARGRKRDGEERVFLTPEQLKDIKDRKLLA